MTGIADVAHLIADRDHRRTRARFMIFAVAMLVGMLIQVLLHFGCARADTNPRYFAWSGTGSSGAPFITGSWYSPVDTAAIRLHWSRFAVVALAPSPFADDSVTEDGRPDVLLALRAANPSVILLAHVIVERDWGNDDTEQKWHSRLHRLFREHNAVLATGGHVNVNLAAPGLAPAIADLLDELWDTGLWDGFALEVCPSPTAEWLGAELRRRCPGILILQSCGRAGTLAGSANGNLVEGFPSQHGGLGPNMTGYLSDTLYREPRINVLYSPAHGTAPTYDMSSAENRRRWRFVAACAALGEGYSLLAPGEPSYRGWERAPLPWPPGSFGEPLGEPYALTSGTVTLWCRDFQKGRLTVNSSDRSSAAGLAARDARFDRWAGEVP